jgi:hypothetical protein
MVILRMVLALFILCRMGAGPAHAINWKGHDDWLEDSPPALELERHFDHRVMPLPPARTAPDCQKREDVGTVPANPYEPVPLLCSEERNRGTRVLP